MSSAATLVRRAVTSEVDGYTSSVAGVELESVRAGRGKGPSEVVAVSGDRLTFTSSRVGFPMLTRATIGDDAIALTHIRSTSRGSCWCGIDLVPGAVMAYGPEAEHVAVNNPGFEFTFAVVACDQLLANAAELGIHMELPARGALEVLAPSARVTPLCDVLPTFAAIAESGSCPPERVWDRVLRAMVHALSEDDRLGRTVGTNRIDSRRVIRACSDYPVSIGRIPSISELCLVAHVSERRLRQAFVDEFDMPPSRFFRAWALGAAHQSLLAASRDGRDTTVTRIASDLGFAHLGRFAGQYRTIYGEMPSRTLRKPDVPT